MPVYQPLRLLAMLGVATVEDVTSEHLQRLIDVSAEETSELEFKRQPHQKNEADNLELAKDVAAMANGAGGAIVVGVEEGADNTAGTLVDLDLEGGYAERLQQVLAGRVFPMPQVGVHRVPTGAPRGQYLVVIPPSPLAPHAVAGDAHGRRDQLTYWVRDGNVSRALAEVEVADRYRSRFTRFTEVAPRTQSLVADVDPHLGNDDNGGLWLVLTCVPTRLGALSPNATDVDSFKNWISALRRDGPPDALHLGQCETFRKGVRRRTATATNPFQVAAKYNYLELHDDGAGVVAVQQIQYQQTAQLAGVGRLGADLDYVIRGQVVEQALAALFTLSQHAIRCGAGGDAIVTARVVKRDQSRGVVLLQPHGFTVYGVATVEPLRLPPTVVDHTFVIDALVTRPRELVLAARLVAGDIFADFGHEELFGFDDAGTISIANLGEPSSAPALRAWASKNSIEIFG